MMTMEAAARTDGVYIRALPMPPPLMWHLPFVPRDLDEPYLLPKHLLKAKDVIRTNGDEIGEESPVERKSSVRLGSIRESIRPATVI
jgi:hypothetical protein